MNLFGDSGEGVALVAGVAAGVRHLAQATDLRSCCVAVIQEGLGFAIGEADVGHSAERIVLVAGGLVLRIRHRERVTAGIAGISLLANIGAGLSEHFAPSVAGELGAHAFGVDGLGELVELVVVTVGLLAIGQLGGDGAAQGIEEGFGGVA